MIALCTIIYRIYHFRLSLFHTTFTVNLYATHSQQNLYEEPPGVPVPWRFVLRRQGERSYRDTRRSCLGRFGADHQRGLTVLPHRTSFVPATTLKEASQWHGW